MSCDRFLHLRHLRDLRFNADRRSDEAAQMAYPVKLQEKARFFAAQLIRTAVLRVDRPCPMGILWPCTLPNAPA